MDSTSLQVSEAAAVWSEHSLEVFSIILIAIKRMGFAKSLEHTFESIQADGRCLPNTRRIRLALIEAVDFHVEVYERVERAFFRAVSEGRIDRACVGGWLNRATRRQTWKRAIPRARTIAYELSALVDDNSTLENTAGADLTPEELLALREFTTRYATIFASLSVEDRMLIDAKLERRGYASLAAAWQTTEEALKTRVSRLLKRLQKTLGEAASTNVPLADD